LSGIYLHIPYCKQKCHYCNFYSLASVKHRNELVPAMLNEIELQNNYLEGEPVSTIYLGGGTPSLLSGNEITRFLAEIKNCFNVDPDAEITLEANPDDLSKEKLIELKQSGINRLSIGIQSFNDSDLKFLNRIHTSAQGYDCILNARDAGFSNISIDLIYGIPTLDSVSWNNNLNKAIDLDIPHISAYALTVEEKTPLAVMISKGKMPNVDDAVQVEHFNMLVGQLQNAGYLHYEISNFCKPGWFARHNTSYWKGISYLGIGPSAHSFNRISRQWNVANLGQYIQSLGKNEVPYEREILSPTQRFNEYIMTSLRTQWGCELSFIQQQFGREWAEQVIQDAEKHLGNGLLKLDDGILYLTREGKFRADGIAADLFRLV
jgi:oxygen-independent coproporphyrinogen III oxidase